MTPYEFDKQLAEQIGRFFNDPLGFVTFAFPWGKPGTPLEAFPHGPEDWHREEFEIIKQHVTDNLVRKAQGIDTEAYWSAVTSGHGVAKSAGVAWLILWFMSTRPDCRGVVTANTENQLTDKTWPELAKWHSLAINGHWFKWTSTQFYYAYYPENQRKNYCFSAVPWSEEKTEGFAGLHNASSSVVIIFDEASAISDKLWEVAEGAMTDGEAWFLARGNPTRNVGRFYECFHKYRGTMTFLKAVDSRTVRVTNKTRLQRIIDRYGIDHDITRMRVLGKFPKGSLDGYIPYDLVFEAQQRDLVKDPMAPLIMAVDAARFGEDQMVIRCRQGNDARSIPPLKFRKLDTVQAADRVADAIERYDPDAIVVEGGGPGGGLIDTLRRRGFRIIEFSPGAPASNPRKYVNRRAEMYGDMRGWLAVGGCIDEDSELASDMTQIGFKFRESDNALQLESKREMKKRGLPSPDDADALGLTFAVKPPRRDQHTSRYGPDRRRVAKNVDYSVLGD